MLRSRSTSTRARAALGAVLAAALAAAAPVGGTPAGAASGDTVFFTDNFETGVLADRWDVITGVNGTAAIEAGIGVGGSRAAHLIVPDGTSGSIANISHDAPADTYGLSVSGSFRVLSAGCNPDAYYSSGNVPFVRMFDANNQRLVGLYRINGPTCGDNTKLYVQHSGGFYRVNVNMKFNTWYNYELRASVAAPGQSLVQVYVNGSLKFQTTVANNGLLPIDHFTIHNEHINQQGNLVVDNVTAATFGSAAPPPNPCTPATPLPTNSDPGTVVLADGFESYTFSGWSEVGQGGDGVAAIVTNAHTGTCAARLRSTSGAESKANLQRNLPSGTADVWADGWFNVQGEGASNSNVPFFRVFAGTTRAIDVYRQNVSGEAWMRLPTSGGTVYVKLNRTIALNTWHEVKVHAVANAGGGETVEVWLDGQLVHSSNTNELGLSSFTHVMVGSEHASQVIDLLADDIVIKRAG